MSRTSPEECHRLRRGLRRLSQRWERSQKALAHSWKSSLGVGYEQAPAKLHENALGNNCSVPTLTTLAVSYGPETTENFQYRRFHKAREIVDRELSMGPNGKTTGELAGEHSCVSWHQMAVGGEVKKREGSLTEQPASPVVFCLRINGCVPAVEAPITKQGPAVVVCKVVKRLCRVATFPIRVPGFTARFSF